MNDVVKTLGTALSEAQALRRKLEHEKRAWVDEREGIIAQEAAKLFDDRIAEARAAATLAQTLHNNAVVEARTADTGWLPVGTRVWRKERQRYGADRTLQGLVEVWSAASARPYNRTYFPATGAVVVRLLKANGEPSQMFDDRVDEATRNGWQEVK